MITIVDAENKYFAVNENDITGDGVFVSKAFDSGQNGTVWHRARLVCDAEDVTLSFFASDTAAFFSGSTHWGKPFKAPQDVLLHGYSGRYLWFRAEFGGLAPKLFRLRLYYPAHSFVRYLPEIYQSAMDSFFVRFVAIFQSIYLDMEERIDNIPARLEPLGAGGKQTALLARWLSCTECKFLPEDKKGEFLTKCVHFYKSAGTRAGIEALFEWLCGEKPLIIEYFQFAAYTRQKRITRLYGNNPHRFTVIFRTYDQLSVANAMLDSMKPAHSKYKSVTLKDEVRLDTYTYLGINSVCV